MVHAGHVEVRLAPKRLSHVVGRNAVVVKLNDGQDKVLRLVERGADLVAGGGGRAGDASLDSTASQEAGQGGERRGSIVFILKTLRPATRKSQGNQSV